MKYLAVGLTMVDEVQKSNSITPLVSKGGSPIYNYSGARFWSSDIGFVTKAGDDYYEIYNPWFDDNAISKTGIEILKERVTPRCIIKYDEDGDLTETISFMTGDWADADIYRPDGNSLLNSINARTKGVCICSPPPSFAPFDFWETLFKLRLKYGFKIMWEPNNIHTKNSDKSAIDNLLHNIDMASFNKTEGMSIFGVSSTDELKDYLAKFDLELMLLRLGSKGLIVFDNKECYKIPAIEFSIGVVDTTGCGNAATAAAMVAKCNGDDILMSGIKATVSAAFNYLQKGPVPLFTDKLIDEAEMLALKYYNDYRGRIDG